MASYVAATRGSRLALAQAHAVISDLKDAVPGTACRELVVRTGGDADRRPLFLMDRRGIFSKEVDGAVLDGRADFAVHSMKDLPTDVRPGLCIACVPRREDACDVLVTGDGSDLGSLREGAVVGTSSLRRAVQISRARPDVVVRPVRGNVETRISRVPGEYDAVVLAAAGIRRLGLEVPHSRLPEEGFVPSPGQGALALVSREGSPASAALAAIEDRGARREAEAERAFSAAIGSGCRFPVGARATSSGGRISIRAEAFSADGSERVSASASGDDPAAAGRAAAGEMLGRGAARLALNWRQKLEEWNA
ncbi:MAG: hydroxymethylbilane synthase [Nitrosopumilus sp.]|nr:hydroxymethylbilane synthase [Nitrosopumilus sp.]MDA7957706.1 hydroxymethylbilane synthase [Nitrosopumilus sp.]